MVTLIVKGPMWKPSSVPTVSSQAREGRGPCFALSPRELELCWEQESFSGQVRQGRGETDSSTDRFLS